MLNLLAPKYTMIPINNMSPRTPKKGPSSFQATPFSKGTGTFIPQIPRDNINYITQRSKHFYLKEASKEQKWLPKQTIFEQQHSFDWKLV